jgi:Fur family transcriptional regulator, zinc uptake regulator
MAHNHDHDHADLTRNQKLVLGVIAKSKQPQSAYDILDKLRGQGFKAPLQVYRALDKLQEQGLVHRLESLSAFIACQHTEGEAKGATVFMICDECGTVSERTNSCISGDLQKLAKADGFNVAQTSIEIRGRCGRH